MALGMVTELALNDVYASMLEERKLLKEGSDNNLIHAEIEEILNDFKSKISIEGIQEKIRDVEKYEPLTAAEKNIIKSIQKVLDALDALEKVDYAGIITMVAKAKKDDSKAEMEEKDKEFADNMEQEKTEQAPADQPPSEEEFDFSK
jgi:type I site-specific restriction-modification system R (restriction) subunit